MILLGCSCYIWISLSSLSGTVLTACFLVNMFPSPVLMLRTPYSILKHAYNVFTLPSECLAVYVLFMCAVHKKNRLLGPSNVFSFVTLEPKSGINVFILSKIISLFVQMSPFFESTLYCSIRCQSFNEAFTLYIQ